MPEDYFHSLARHVALGCAAQRGYVCAGSWLRVRSPVRVCDGVQVRGTAVCVNLRGFD